MTGLNDLLDGLVLNRTPHIRLYNELNVSDKQPSEFDEELAGSWNVIHSIKPHDAKLSVHNASAIMNYLQSHSAVQCVSGQTDVQVFYNAGSVDLNGVVTGIVPKVERDYYDFDNYIYEGSSQNLDKLDNAILLGSGLAKKLGLDVGDRVQIRTSQGANFSLKVVGLFQSGLADIDNVQSYVLLKTAQRMLGKGNDFVSNIHIKLKNINSSPYWAKIWKSKFDTDAIDIFRANAQFDTGSSIRTLISYAVSITLLIVAGFGIYNILNMMIYEKMDEIAILKATGFSPTDVQNIFLSQAIIIGFFGAIIGLVLGFFVALWIDHIPFDTEALPTIKTYPVNFKFNHYFIGVIFALLSTFFAGYLPSRKAKNIDPVDIIRGK